MPANWSLIVNLLMLIGVVVAIVRVLKSRRQHMSPPGLGAQTPVLGAAASPFSDDIIAVRKISTENSLMDFAPADESFDVLSSQKIHEKIVPEEPIQTSNRENQAGKSLMIFLQAKEKRTLAGYELLQTLLAAGLRFGEGQLFHRHQYPNGQGPVLCSLAAATPTGVFDLQNIGAFNVRGLCLFMRSSGNAGIDEERFQVMMETALQLNDDLDTLMLDDHQRPFTEKTVQRYCHILNVEEMDISL